jgi:DGQHR domain-containing protein
VGKPARRKAKPKLSAAEKAANKARRDHIRRVRVTLKNLGFLRYPELADKAFTFDGQQGDYDDVFSYENVVITLEYTSTRESSRIGDHLRKKKVLYDKIDAGSAEFLKLLRDLSPALDTSLSAYHDSQVEYATLYASLYDFDQSHRQNIPNPVYLDYPALRYFQSVGEAIEKSGLPEFLNFVGIPPDRLGKAGVLGVSLPSHTYRGSALPEAHSGYPTGYKVVTFYADPRSLLERAYVLRRAGWRESDNLYQRMVSKVKISSIRAYLRATGRVFVNNVVVTLPADTEILDAESRVVDPAKINRTTPVGIRLPQRPDSVGLVDGQHRVFAYYEGVKDEAFIAGLRSQQNLLVTGIIAPPSLSTLAKEQFEARLFLEINSNQTSAKSDLKHAITLVLDPYAPSSIATRVLNGLASRGPLAGKIERYFFDENRIKTTSVVSYGLQALVRIDGDESLFKIWREPRKELLRVRSDGDHLGLLHDYVEFCTVKINDFLSGIRDNFPPNRWTADKKISDRVLTTTTLNAFLILMRICIRNKKPIGQGAISPKLTSIKTFDWTKFHSSQYARAAQELYDQMLG